MSAPRLQVFAGLVEEVGLADPVEQGVLVATRHEQGSVHQVRETAAEDVEARGHRRRRLDAGLRVPDRGPRGVVGLGLALVDGVVGDDLSVRQQRHVDPHHRPVDDRPPLSHLARVVRGPSLCSRHVRRRDPGGPTLESALLFAAVDDEVLFEVVRHRAGCRMMSLRARGNGGAQDRYCHSGEGDSVAAQTKGQEHGPAGHVGISIRQVKTVGSSHEQMN